MREARDARVAGREIPPAARQRPHDELEGIPGQVLEPDELVDVAGLALLGRPSLDRPARAFQDIGGFGERRRRGNLESRRVIARVAFEVHERVIAVVAAEVSTLPSRRTSCRPRMRVAYSTAWSRFRVPRRTYCMSSRLIMA